MERDRMNSQSGEYRYFCSETYRDQGYDYSRPTYDDYDDQDYGNGNGNGNNTCYDTNRDGMCDNYNQPTTPNTCNDYNNDGYCD
jgi:hypothetical protein